MPGLKESNARLGDGSYSENHRRTRDRHPTGRRDKIVPENRRRTGAGDTPAGNLFRRHGRGPPISFSVNALAADESDLSACASGQWGQWSEDTERRLEETSAVWIFGLLALAC